MTAREFMNLVANGERDVLQDFLDAVGRAGADYCVIGGLAVNAYAEPVVSLDLDVIVAATDVSRICDALSEAFRIERFPHSVNLTSPKSAIRIQLQTDPRYQSFLALAVEREVMGYRLRVARIEDVLRGKLWAYADASRRKSKRQKDLADIARLVEVEPGLKDALPADLRRALED